MYMLERARDKGVRLIEGRVERVETTGGRVTGVGVSGRDGTRTIGTPRFVNAAGPFLKDVGRLLGVELPVFCERHAKVAFHDTLGVVPRHAPMMIWTDPVRLPWSDDERAELGAGRGAPASAGGDARRRARAARGRGRQPDHARRLDLRRRADGAALPDRVRSGPRRDRAPRPDAAAARASPPTCHACPKCFVDGGYYTKTQENRFLSCPLPIEGAYVLGGLSGYGMMSSNGAADLLADYIAERPLPHYAPAFHLDRYQDPAYQRAPRPTGATPASSRPPRPSTPGLPVLHGVAEDQVELGRAHRAGRAREEAGLLQRALDQRGRRRARCSRSAARPLGMPMSRMSDEQRPGQRLAPLAPRRDRATGTPSSSAARRWRSGAVA